MGGAARDIRKQGIGNVAERQLQITLNQCPFSEKDICWMDVKHKQIKMYQECKISKVKAQNLEFKNEKL